MLVSPTHIYPGPVGVDIKCSMSLLQLDLPADADRRPADPPGADRRHLRAHSHRPGQGPAQRAEVAPGRRRRSGRQVVIEGASPAVCDALGIPADWAAALRRLPSTSATTARSDALADRLDRLLAAGALPNFDEKIRQLGSYGGGNHFGECEVVQVADNAARTRRRRASSA